jgi:hypothetical protein
MALQTYDADQENDEIIVELSAIILKLAGQAGFHMQRLVAQIQPEEAASTAGGIQMLQPLPASAATVANRPSFQQIRFTHS